MSESLTVNPPAEAAEAEISAALAVPAAAAAAAAALAVDDPRLAVQLDAAELRHEIHNFDPTDPDDAVRYIAAACGDAKSIADESPEYITCVRFLVRPIELVRPETGEAIKTARTVIIDDKGEQWATASPVAARTLIALWKAGNAAAIRGKPIRLRVDRPKTDRGRVPMIVLTPMLPPPKPIGGPEG